jgi:hypothetical protein
MVTVCVLCEAQNKAEETVEQLVFYFLNKISKLKKDLYIVHAMQCRTKRWPQFNGVN